ncbi:MAG: hypothetical protein AAGH40_13785 [Verrucomicrobiota bacterium]
MKKLTIILILIIQQTICSAVEIVLFDEPIDVLRDPFAPTDSRSTATIPFKEALSITQQEHSQIEGMHIFESVRDYLSDRNATIIDLRRKGAGLADPSEEGVIYSFPWYVVTWQNRENKTYHFFAILKDGTVIPGIEKKLEPGG